MYVRTVTYLVNCQPKKLMLIFAVNTARLPALNGVNLIPMSA